MVIVEGEGELEGGKEREGEGERGAGFPDTDGFSSPT